ncbi:hypothetical protein FRB94_013258 [Tulasnella sp. JGI-2019a]|nr:hypothetical protein FRB93_001964 [Tulasnella sp. JGI-2019a]KAG9008434.1 hypothetical protein FRB94_013258 [Tulasnella sp. JGI-2019a]KAG9031439.1 hypothetical protein FRB95_002739 [Tulasnella sp. JGI-2019a]
MSSKSTPKPIRTSTSGIPSFVKAAEIVEAIAYTPTTQWDYPHEGNRGAITQYNYQVITATPAVQLLSLSLEELRLAYLFSQHGLTTPAQLTSQLPNGRYVAPSTEALGFLKAGRSNEPLRNWEKQLPISLSQGKSRQWTGPATKQLLLHFKSFCFGDGTTPPLSSATTASGSSSMSTRQFARSMNESNERLIRPAENEAVRLEHEALKVAFIKEAGGLGLSKQAEEALSGDYEDSRREIKNLFSGYNSRTADMTLVDDSSFTARQEQYTSTKNAKRPAEPLTAFLRSLSPTVPSTPDWRVGRARPEEPRSRPLSTSTMSFANLSIDMDENEGIERAEHEWEEKRRNLSLRKAELARAKQEYDMAAEEEAMAFRQYSGLRQSYDV